MGEGASIVDAFDGLDVVVIGDVILDSYLEGHTERLCREAPVPIVGLSSSSDVPGGAANTAANLAALGAKTTLLSVVGEDPEASALRRALGDAGVLGHGLVVDPDRRTLAKRRLMADGQMVARVDQGSDEPLNEASERALVERLEGAYRRCDALVVSDYGCGAITAGVIAAIAGLREGGDGRVVALDSKRPDELSSLRPSLVKPNREEAAGVLQRAGIPQPPRLSPDTLAPFGDVLLEATGGACVAVTLDADGGVVFESSGSPTVLLARRCDNPHPSGAGDAFLAAMTLALAAGLAPPAAARIGLEAAAVAVAKPGTAPCSREELRDALGGGEKYEPEASRLAGRLQTLRATGRKVVFTNGCFDILHRGHIEYLDRARGLGDVLVVGINTDESVSRIKGPDRPVNPLSERVQVLSALSSVDHIVPFDEETAGSLIAELRPDVFAKGGDYLRETIPEAPIAEALGVELVIVPYVENRSTSGIIERIRSYSSGSWT